MNLIRRFAMSPFAGLPSLVAALLLAPGTGSSAEKKAPAADWIDSAAPLFHPVESRPLLARIADRQRAPTPAGGGDGMKTNRHRPVRLNPKVAAGDGFAVGEAIELELFGDRIHRARVDHVSTNVHGTVTVRARIEDSRWGHVLISTTNGISLGNIVIPETGEEYVLQSEGGSDHYLAEIDGSGYLPRLCEIPLPPRPESRERVVQGLASEAPDPMEPVTVDLMIAYTPAARDWADTTGGGMFNVIAQSMAKANLALENSATLLSWNLVQAIEVNYTESGNSQVDLIRLTTSPDFQPYGDIWEGYEVSGYMDELHAMRDASGADLVTLLASVEDTGGLAWVLDSTTGSPQWGFGLTRVQQASSTFSHAHEVGHNFGLHHHRDQTFHPGPGIFDYSAGWRWIGDDTTAYSSVMTYGAGKYFVDGRTHTGVGYFSNPDIIHAGLPTGHPSYADNARTLRTTKHLVAAYRSQVELSLGHAVGRPEWEWRSGGEVPWSVQALGFDSGGHAAQSGLITHSGESWLETTFEGPGTLSFRWKISSERNYDYLHFYVNRQERDRIAGEVGWELKTYTIPAGTHTVKWVYAKDPTVTLGSDAAWLDDVVWVPGAVEPSTFTEWRTHAQLSLDLSGFEADPGGAGIPNWHRYAFGLDPRQPDRAELPTVEVLPLEVEGSRKEYLTVTFNRSFVATDIIYRPQASSDLVHWESLASVEFLVDGSATGDWHRVTYRDLVPVEAVASRFLRVAVLSIIGEAVEQPRRDWLTGGNAPWFVQGNDVFSGGSSVQSGPILDDQQSWVEMVVEGPGTISFWWKVSSEAGWDFLGFSRNNEELTSISGEIGWKERTFLLSKGTHTLRWRYTKDGSVAEGEDAGWLDQVVWLPDQE